MQIRELKEVLKNFLCLKSLEELTPEKLEEEDFAKVLVCEIAKGNKYMVEDEKGVKKL